MAVTVVTLDVSLVRGTTAKFNGELHKDVFDMVYYLIFLEDK